MISRTTSATLSRNTSGCSDRMICSTASRAAVILWPSAIVVLLRQFLAGTDDHEARGGRTTLSPARLLHHFYRLDPAGMPVLRLRPRRSSELGHGGTQWNVACHRRVRRA